MKRLIAFLFLLVLPAQAITVEVDGQTLPTEPPPILVGGRVLMPMRSIFTALGATVHYRAGRITATRGRRTIELQLDNPRARVDGKAVSLDSSPRLVNGHTYVPLRFVGQALGDEVVWRSKLGLVEVSRKPTVRSSKVYLTARDLGRVAVGNQGGVLKVWDASKTEVLVYRGLDDRSTAQLSALDRRQILDALGVADRPDLVAADLLDQYPTLPQKETLALLGVLNGLTPNPGVPRFLVDRMKNDPKVINRRQAVLALAVGETVDLATVEAVIDFYRGSENLWETFPVQQFFEYHGPRIKQWPEYAALRARVAPVNSLYRENILSYL